MAIVTISRGTYTGGKELASKLASMLGYKYLPREELSDRATRMGVPVGKLQMAMVKPPRVYQRLARERDQYLACITMLLCEEVLQGDLVFQGHTGHLLLPGVPNILRVRVLAELEFRIRAVMQQHGLSREKAKEYVTSVDTDRDKWVRFLYGVDWHDPFNYDLVVNLDQTGIGNASSVLCSMAQLPDFKLTPAAERSLTNLHLASKAHYALATDKRTSYADVKVTANNGAVQVTYLPQQSEVAPYVQEVLAKISEIKEVNTTIARSSILYLQEKFDPESPSFGDVIRVAKKWDAAVELMCVAAEGKCPGEEAYVAHKDEPSEVRTDKNGEYTGGIQDDTETTPKFSTDIARSLDELVKCGCSGGSSAFYGKPEALLSALQRRSTYSMVVLGNLYIDKSPSVRTRMKSELKSLFGDRLTVPVVDDTELQQHFTFGIKHLITMLVSLAVAAAIFVSIFLNQEHVVNFLSGEEFKHLRWLALIGVVLLVPLFAVSYGTFTRQLLRLLRLD